MGCSRRLKKTPKSDAVSGLTHMPRPSTIHGGELRELTGETQQHVAAGDQDAQAGGSVGEHLPVGGQLHIQQGLVEPLAGHAAQRLEGKENLARRGVGGQTAALPRPP